MAGPIRREHRSARFAACAILAATLLSCTRPPVTPPSSAPRISSSPYWVDLRAGWRVRVVTPILKTGGYVVKTSPAPADKSGQVRTKLSPARNGSAVVSLSAGPGFVGYEVSRYAVTRRRGGGVRLTFLSATVHKKGKAASARQPIKPLFLLPKQDRWVRILHLIRVSRADHDCAILAASRRNLLETLTLRVRSDPSACKSGPLTFCAWVPLGIAVIPQAKRRVNGKEQWVSM
jgi:hypothetical protein